MNTEDVINYGIKPEKQASISFLAQPIYIGMQKVTTTVCQLQHHFVLALMQIGNFMYNSPTIGAATESADNE